MEKVYHAMKHAGIVNIVTGTVVVVTGVAAGVLMIVSGAMLLKKKRGLTF